MYVSTKFFTFVEWAVTCGLLYFFYCKLRTLIIHDNHALNKKLEAIIQFINSK